MGKIFIMTNHSGGGADTSVVTATASDVLVGKIIVDAEGEPIAGSMANQGTVAPNALNAGSSYIIPQGYHSGSGIVTTNSLANQTPGTATANNILVSKTAWVNGEQVVGTMIDQGAKTSALNCGGSYTIPAGYHNGSGKVTANSLSSQTSATATAAQIISGQTAWVNGSKLTGTLAVQSVITFKAASSAYNSVTFTWQNPAKGAFSGVIIVGKTGSYPTSISDGTRYYKGSGNNAAANGTSSATVSSFSASTAYYFRCFAYAVKNNAEWVGSSLTATATTPAKPKGTQTFTSSGTFTVPSGVTSIDIFCVGGGGGGGAGYNVGDYSWHGPGSGGGAGFTSTKKAYAVSPGAKFTVTIGAGGAGSNAGTAGGTTSFGSVVSASGGAGGKGGGSEPYAKGGNGGSGGGGGHSKYGGKGGSDGSAGSYPSSYSGSSCAPGTGQGTTTRAFAETSNTLYAGGGGAGGYSTGAAGGAGGGGKGGNRSTRSVYATAGTANTGGGGGGASSANASAASYAAAGGSGICIVRWGY